MYILLLCNEQIYITGIQSFVSKRITRLLFSQVVSLTVKLAVYVRMGECVCLSYLELKAFELQTVSCHFYPLYFIHCDVVKLWRHFAGWVSLKF